MAAMQDNKEQVRTFSNGDRQGCPSYADHNGDRQGCPSCADKGARNHYWLRHPETVKIAPGRDGDRTPAPSLANTRAYGKMDGRMSQDRLQAQRNSERADQ